MNRKPAVPVTAPTLLLLTSAFPGAVSAQAPAPPVTDCRLHFQ